jgi:hypothetical protein
MKIGLSIKDLAIGLVSGYVGDLAMTAVTTKLYELESPEDRRKETEVSPGVSYDIAARQLASRVGVRLSGQQEKSIGSLFHHGLGLNGGVMYMFLRRRLGLGPATSALAVSMALFLGLDEGLTPALGWSAPNSAYPLTTHIRGLLGHLTLGAAIAPIAEVLSRMLD